MVCPSETYFASIPVIAMKSSGCLRFRKCPRAGGGGRLIGFRRAKASPPRWPNPDVARAKSVCVNRQRFLGGTMVPRPSEASGRATLIQAAAESSTSQTIAAPRVKGKPRFQHLCMHLAFAGAKLPPICPPFRAGLCLGNEKPSAICGFPACPRPGVLLGAVGLRQTPEAFQWAVKRLR